MRQHNRSISGFCAAFRALEDEQPVYSKGSQTWWSQVIKRTALGAGADAEGTTFPLCRATFVKIQAPLICSSRCFFAEDCGLVDESVQFQGRLQGIS